MEETLGGPDLFIIGNATGLKNSLHDIQRSSDRGGDGTGKTTCNTVGEGVIFVGGVHDLGEGFVGNELGGGKGDGHAKSSRIGDVESLKTLSPVDGARALGDASVSRPVDLHSLL